MQIARRNFLKLASAAPLLARALFAKSTEAGEIVTLHDFMPLYPGSDIFVTANHQISGPVEITGVSGHGSWQMKRDSGDVLINMPAPNDAPAAWYASPGNNIYVPSHRHVTVDGDTFTYFRHCATPQ